MAHFFDELSKQAANAVSRRDALKSTGRAIVGLVLTSTPLAKLWGEISAGGTIFTAQVPTVVAGAGNILGVTLPVVNSGAQPVSDVTVTAIRLQLESGDDDYVKLIAPTILPINVGNIPAGGQFLIDATFGGRHLRVGTEHVFTVRGTYVIGATASRFSVQQVVTIPGPPTFALGVNKTDELLLEAEAANGDVIDYFGPKDVNGFAIGLSTVLFRTAEGAVHRYDLDSQGRPVQALLNDSTTFVIDWSSPTAVLVTAISADGGRRVTVSIGLSTLSASQLTAILKISPSVTQALPATAAANLMAADPSGPIALIHVDRCNHPVDNASVVLRWFPANPNIPSHDLAAAAVGMGTYSVAMPSLGASVTNFENACAAIVEWVGGACTAAKWLGNICFSAYSLFDPPFFADCVAAYIPIVAACELNGGGLAEGAPNVLESLCTLVTKAIDLAENGSIQLQPIASLPGRGTVSGQSVTADANGPYPDMYIHFPGNPCGSVCCVPNVEVCCGDTVCCGASTICCGTTCGAADSVLCGTICCDPSVVCCGTTCCAPGQSCQNGTCTACPAGTTACGQVCCPSGTACCPNPNSVSGFSCAPPGYACCASPSLWCGTSELCCADGCCPAVYAAAGYTCCHVGLLSPQGPCCPPGYSCCPGAPPLGCCAPGTTCTTTSTGAACV